MNLSLGRVFLSYASEDRERVLRLYENLKTAGFEPWIDVRDIPKGSDWDASIQGAIRGSGVFVACVSKASAPKRGVLEAEIDAALVARKGRKVLFVPVRLDETPVPEKLSHIQWVDFKNDESWRDVAAVIRQQETRIGRRRWLMAAGALLPVAASGGYLYWRRRSVREGGPGPGAAVLAANLLRIRRARAGDPAEARFVMNPTPHNGLSAPAEMCTEQLAVGAELDSTDLVLLRISSSRAGHVYVIDQELSPKPKRPILLVDGARVKAGETISLPPSPAGSISYLRFDAGDASYAGEQLTLIVAPRRLDARVDRSTGAAVLDARDWDAWQRDYPPAEGVAGTEFHERAVPESEGSKEIRVETASATYRAPARQETASARITLRVRRRLVP